MTGSSSCKAANGTFDLTGRGVVIGQIDKGAVRVQSLTGSSAQQIAVSGAEHVHATDDPNTTVYSGSNIHIRVSGGKYHLHFKGAGVDLTAVGVGVSEIQANPVAFDFGSFAVDGGKWTTVPLADKFVLFGTQPASPTPGP